MDKTRRNIQEQEEDNAFLEDDLFEEDINADQSSNSHENGNQGEKQKNCPKSFNNTYCSRLIYLAEFYT